MLNADELPFDDIDSMMIEIRSQQFWQTFRIKFTVNKSITLENQKICDVTITQTEKVNGKAFSAAELIESGKSVFEDVISKGFIIRFNPVPYIGLKKELPKFLLLADPYDTLPGRTLIYRNHFPKFIYEINREEEDSQHIEIDGVRYSVIIRENLDDQVAFDATHLKEVVSWYHYSKGLK